MNIVIISNNNEMLTRDILITKINRTKINSEKLIVEDGLANCECRDGKVYSKKFVSIFLILVERLIFFFTFFIYKRPL